MGYGTATIHLSPRTPKRTRAIPHRDPTLRSSASPAANAFAAAGTIKPFDQFTKNSKSLNINTHAYINARLSYPIYFLQIGPTVLITCESSWSQNPARTDPLIHQVAPVRRSSINQAEKPSPGHIAPSLSFPDLWYPIRLR